MNVPTFARNAALLAAGLAVGHTLAAQEGGQDQERTDPGAPGPIHEAMATHAGEWTTETKFRMGPDAEPEISEGSAHPFSCLSRFLHRRNGLSREQLSIIHRLFSPSDQSADRSDSSIPGQP